MEFRLNINTQIKGYYSLMFTGECDLSPNHTSLYMFLLNQNNRTYWSEWFKCPFDLAMMGAGIHSKGTYYKILKDLERFKLIEYKRGINDYKAPKIKICDLSSVSNSVPQSEPLYEPQSDTATVPLPEPLPTPQHIPLPTTLPTHIYKLLTDNLKRITDNMDEVIKFLDGVDVDNRRRKPFKKPTIQEVREFFSTNGYDPDFGETRWHYYEDANWFDSHGSPVLNWKQKMRSVWFKPENKKAAQPYIPPVKLLRGE